MERTERKQQYVKMYKKTKIMNEELVGYMNMKLLVSSKVVSGFGKNINIMDNDIRFGLNYT